MDFFKGKTVKTIREYIDEGIRNGYAKNPAEMSKAVGVAEATVSRWRSGERTPTDEEAVRLASLLRKDAGEILAECGAARAKSPETRRAWEKVAARIASYGITARLLIMTVPYSEQARASQGSASYSFQKIKRRFLSMCYGLLPCL